MADHHNNLIVEFSGDDDSGSGVFLGLNACTPRACPLESMVEPISFCCCTKKNLICVLEMHFLPYIKNVQFSKNKRGVALHPEHVPVCSTTLQHAEISFCLESKAKGTGRKRKHRSIIPATLTHKK